MEKKRILIVDDDADFVLAVRMVLESAGYLADDAADGRSALDKMRQNRPAVVLMDVMMASPLDGYYTTQLIADDAELSSIPIVMISSIAESKYAASFPTDQYLNIVDFLSKPVEPGVILAKVKRWAGE